MIHRVCGASPKTEAGRGDVHALREVPHVAEDRAGNVFVAVLEHGPVPDGGHQEMDRGALDPFLAVSDAAGDRAEVSPFQDFQRVVAHVIVVEA